MRVQWGETDGVTTVSVPDRAPAGPASAGLVFGSGRCDETLLVSGVNHVIEHLALNRVGYVPYSWNGTVDTLSTSFLVHGDATQMVGFFRSVTEALADLPFDRLEQETRILAIEDERHGASQAGTDLERRFGARGAGLIGWPEHGLRRIEPDEIRRWLETYFVRGNAVFWCAGPVPSELDLTALRAGGSPLRPPCPTVECAPRTWIPARTNIVSISMISDGRWGVLPMMRLAQQRAQTRLRVQEAVSYSVAPLHLRLDGDRTLEYLGSDGAGDAYGQVLDGLTAVVDELAETGPTAEEIERLHQVFAVLPDHGYGAEEYLASEAERHLVGRPPITPEEGRDRLLALTAHEMRDELAAILPTLLAIGPQEIGDSPAGWRADVEWSREVVLGRAYQAIGEREEGILMVGPDGASWVGKEGGRAVRWNDAIACFTWDSGARSLVGEDRRWVYIAPWNWREAEALTELVDQHIEPGRRIRLGPGDTIVNDPQQPGWSAHVRWLASLSNCRFQGDLVDLVIDTDGLFLLHLPTPRVEPQERVRVSRAAEHHELLGADGRNRWLPARDIGGAEFTKRRFGGFVGAKGTLRITLRDTSVLELELLHDDHVRLLLDWLPEVVGSRFTGIFDAAALRRRSVPDW